MKIDKNDIEELEHQLIEAIKNSDLAFLERVMHDDLLGMGPSGQFITKAIDLNSHREGGMVVEKLIPSIDAIEVFEDVAIAVVTYATKGCMFGNPIEGRFRYNRVWKQCDNQLRIISVTCVKI